MTLFIAQILKPFILVAILVPLNYLFYRLFPEGKAKRILSMKIGN